SPTSFAHLMPLGVPIVYYRNWGEKGEEVAEQVWRKPTSAVIGMDLDKDYMVCPPFLYWRETFSHTRRQIITLTHQAFFESVYSDTPFKGEAFTPHPIKFADFESLSLCAAKLEPGTYEVRHHDERPKDWPWRLYWSHGGLNAGIEAELRLAVG